MASRQYFEKGDVTKLFNQYAILDAYLNENASSIASEKATDKKWVIVFRNFVEKSLDFKELLKVVEFALFIPATNATVERVFSHINDIWTSDKGQLKIESVRARLMARFNWKETCSDFHEKIKKDADFLQKVISRPKYQILPICSVKKMLSCRRL